MINLKNIIVGWYRFLFAKRSQMAKDRLKICKLCNQRTGNICSNCGCFLLAKTELDEERCPIGKW